MAPTRPAATTAVFGDDAAGVRRARPLLGTLVDIRIDGWPDARARAAIERAFAEVAAVHRLMSFHDSGSDLDRLHRARRGATVRIDARTHAVLARALSIAAASGGRFDPTVAAQQVAWGRLPRPRASSAPDPRARWSDIELGGANRVRLLRPLWIDLGGIAKGYAVDRAVELLADAGAPQVCVNAGGDLRVHGPRTETVWLRGPRVAEPLLELGNAALATSAGALPRCALRAAVPHVDGASRRAAGFAGESVSVVASSCIVADALTKVALVARDLPTRRALQRHGAQLRVRSIARDGEVAA